VSTEEIATLFRPTNTPERMRESVKIKDRKEGRRWRKRFRLERFVVVVAVVVFTADVDVVDAVDLVGEGGSEKVDSDFFWLISFLLVAATPRYFFSFLIGLFPEDPVSLGLVVVVGSLICSVEDEVEEESTLSDTSGERISSS